MERLEDFGCDGAKEYLPREILKRNKDQSSHGEKWVVCKNHIFDYQSLIDMVKRHLLEIKTERVVQNQSKDNGAVDVVNDNHDFVGKDVDEFDEECDNNDDDDDVDGCEVDNEVCFEDDLGEDFQGRLRGIQYILPTKCRKPALHEQLSLSCVGFVVTHGSAKYWTDIRADVKLVLDDLIRLSLRDHLSRYQAEYLTLLQRWMDQYRARDPSDDRAVVEGDGNLQDFPLPEQVKSNTDCLRSWIATWRGLDLEVPEGGAWLSIPEDDPVDVSDVHEVFTSSLRAGWESLPAFDTSVDGIVAWQVVPGGVIAEDVMTEAQLQVEERRSRRTDLDNVDRMARRRSQLLNYFAVSYNFNDCKVEPFKRWAEEMQNGYARFQSLCNKETTPSGEYFGEIVSISKNSRYDLSTLSRCLDTPEVYVST